MEFIEFIVILILISGVTWLFLSNKKKLKKINNLNIEIDKLQKTNLSLVTSNNKLTHDNIKLDGLLKNILLENNYLKLQLTKISKLMLSINSPRNGKTSDPLSGFDPSTFFNGDDRYTKTQNVKNETTYNVDDILTEISKVGIKNISNEKLNFLKNNSK